MSTFLKTTTLLLAFSFAQNLHAQTVSAADQKGIEECYNAFTSAFEQSNASQMSAWMTDNVEHITPLGELVRGKNNVIAHFTKLFEFFKTLPKPDKTETKNTDWQNRYLANDLILATYTSTDTNHFGDKVQEDKMTMSVLLRKKGDKWVAELITLTPVTPMPVQGK